MRKLLLLLKKLLLWLTDWSIQWK